MVRLRAALDELATAADEPMDETEWQEPPPGVLVAAPVVEAPSEGVTDDDPEEREPEPRIPIFTPSAMEAPGEGPRGGALDLFVALVALALMAISGLGLAYVLG